MTEGPLHINDKIRLISKEAKIVVKQKRGGLPFKAVSHDDVLAMIKPICLDHHVIFFPVTEGFEFTVDGNRTHLRFDLRIQCTESPLSFRDIPTFGFGIDNSDKGAGKAYSYAFKYGLLKGFMLETGDDPDTSPHQEFRREAKINQSKTGGNKNVQNEPF